MPNYDACESPGRSWGFEGVAKSVWPCLGIYTKSIRNPFCPYCTPVAQFRHTRSRVWICSMGSKSFFVSTSVVHFRIAVCSESGACHSVFAFDVLYNFVERNRTTINFELEASIIKVRPSFYFKTFLHCVADGKVKWRHFEIINQTATHLLSQLLITQSVGFSTVKISSHCGAHYTNCFPYLSLTLATVVKKIIYTCIPNASIVDILNAVERSTQWRG